MLRHRDLQHVGTKLAVVSLQDGDGYCVPFESPSDASAWLGSAVEACLDLHWPQWPKMFLMILPILLHMDTWCIVSRSLVPRRANEKVMAEAEVFEVQSQFQVSSSL